MGFGVARAFMGHYVFRLGLVPDRTAELRNELNSTKMRGYSFSREIFDTWQSE